jgi:hypothetical protein
VSELVHLAWERFTIIAGIVGDLQGRAIVTVFYYTILAPFGIGSRIFSDPLQLRSNASPQWQDRPPVQNSLDDAHRQG